MNRKKTMEQLMHYLVDQIGAKERFIRFSEFRYSEAVRENDKDLMEIRKENIKNQQVELIKLKEMLDLVQELHYEEVK